MCFTAGSAAAGTTPSFDGHGALTLPAANHSTGDALAGARHHSAPSASIHLSLVPPVKLPEPVKIQAETEEPAAVLALARRFELDLKKGTHPSRVYQTTCVDVAGLEVRMKIKFL